MPELPEVETVVRGLRRRGGGLRVQNDRNRTRVGSAGEGCHALADALEGEIDRHRGAVRPRGAPVDRHHCEGHVLDEVGPEVRLADVVPAAGAAR